MFKPLKTLPPVSRDPERLPLQNGLFALVDSDVFSELSQFGWTARWQPRTQSFDVVRKKNGKMVYLSREVMCPGLKEVAVKRYDEAATKFFGEFAFLNFGGIYVQAS